MNTEFVLERCPVVVVERDDVILVHGGGVRDHRRPQLVADVREELAVDLCREVTQNQKVRVRHAAGRVRHEHHVHLTVTYRDCGQ